MKTYLKRFSEEERERAFRFFALFSRFEFALKNAGFLKSDRNDVAHADWNCFAKKHARQLEKDPVFMGARKNLLRHPPKQQRVKDGRVRWEKNPKRNHETDAVHLIRVVRDVRNNLFHGGKSPDGPKKETARNPMLLDAAMTILERCLELDEVVRREFKSPE